MPVSTASTTAWWRRPGISTPLRSRRSGGSPGRCPAGVVGGTLLTFIPAAGDFINSRLLGNTQTVMIGQVIDAEFLRVQDYPTAAALSFVLMFLIAVIVAVYVRRAGTEELI